MDAKKKCIDEMFLFLSVNIHSFFLEKRKAKMCLYLHTLETADFAQI